MIDSPLGLGASLVDAIRTIEQSARRIAVVVHPDMRVAGTLTDGDIRRCLLAGGNLDTPVALAMNTKPLTAREGTSVSVLNELLERANLMALPLVNAQDRLVRLVHRTDLNPRSIAGGASSHFSTAVIMAGGEGMRLRPITENIPKPMVDIGGLPIIERQVRRLAHSGVRRVFIAVNYLSHVIEEHFGDGSRLGIEIHYLRERLKLGTAGALSLLPNDLDEHLLVINGDILTTFDFKALHEYHLGHESKITVGAVDYLVKIPYGVLNTEGAYVKGLEEKPSQRFLCNAGIYALSVECMTLVPVERHFNMTDLIRQCLTLGLQVAVFPVHEFWTDVGTPAELQKARETFKALDHAHE